MTLEQYLKNCYELFPLVCIEKFQNLKYPAIIFENLFLKKRKILSRCDVVPGKYIEIDTSHLAVTVHVIID